MAALEQRPVSSVNGDVDVTLDVPGDMTEDDVADPEDIQKEVRRIVVRRFCGRSPPETAALLRQRCVRSDGRPPAVWEVAS